MRRPNCRSGAFALNLETAEAHLTLHIDRHDVRVRSVEMEA
jgi:hypothetical protein